jgi:hypothetical protein
MVRRTLVVGAIALTSMLVWTPAASAQDGSSPITPTGSSPITPTGSSPITPTASPGPQDPAPRAREALPKTGFDPTDVFGASLALLLIGSSLLKLTSDRRRARSAAVPAAAVLVAQDQTAPEAPAPEPKQEFWCEGDLLLRNLR